MGSIKKKIGIAVSAVGLCIVAATFVSVVSANSTDKVEIRLAHNQAAGSEIADSIAKFSEFVAEDDSMNLDVNIYASGVLGSEKEEIEMVQAGILDMAKVSSNTFGTDLKIVILNFLASTILICGIRIITTQQWQKSQQ